MEMQSVLFYLVLEGRVCGEAQGCKDWGVGGGYAEGGDAGDEAVERYCGVGIVVTDGREGWGKERSIGGRVEWVSRHFCDVVWCVGVKSSIILEKLGG
jgi:hypothetical protein